MTPGELNNIYSSERDFWWYRGMRAITDVLLQPLIAGGVSDVLDAGCGTGFNALNLERRYGLRVCGADLARLAIAYCRERGLKRSTIASIARLPFADGSFDLVLSFDVLSHLPPGDDERALQEFVRVLRPGGWMLLRVPAFRALRSRHSQFIAERHRYTARELAGKLAAQGCTVERRTYANSCLSPLALLKFRIWENIRKAPPRSAVEEIPRAWLNNLLTWILKVEAALIRLGATFPFGQSVIVIARKPEEAAE